MSLRCLVLAMAVLTMVTPRVEAQAPGGTGSLGWLAGCWERRTAGLVIEEQWMAPRGGVLLGMSRTVRKDGAVEYESLRIQGSKGRLELVAGPGRGQPTVFRAVDSSTTVLRFENLAHDFPQRIIYRTAGPDSLLARVEGPRGGSIRGIDYPYGRVSCPGGDKRGN